MKVTCAPAVQLPDTEVDGVAVDVGCGVDVVRVKVAVVGTGEVLRVMRVSL